MKTGERIELIFRDVLNIRLPSPTTDLIASGMLDSLALVTLLFEIEQQFVTTIPLEEVDIEQLRTVERIASLVDELTREGQPTPPLSDGLDQ